MCLNRNDHVLIYCLPTEHYSNDHLLIYCLATKVQTTDYCAINKIINTITLYKL